jgi:hypothetical protein
MKVRSPLATFDLGLGAIERRGNSLVVHSRPGGGIEAEITISASEVLCLIGRVLVTPAGLQFVVGLPFFWLRERLCGGGAIAASPARRRAVDDINKPW